MTYFVSFWYPPFSVPPPDSPRNSPILPEAYIRLYTSLCITRKYMNYNEDLEEKLEEDMLEFDLELKIHMNP